MAVAWNRDPAGSEAQINANTQRLLARLVADAPARKPPTLKMADRWHGDLYANVPVPSPSYLGNPRDSDPAHPDLIGYEVRVGGSSGLPSAHVPAALNRLIAQLRSAVRTFDSVVPVGQPPGSDAELRAVIELAALAHGEWVRIHPYANGNGRVARVWANWLALRYGLPPFIAVRPRPAGVLYEAAAAQSMGAPPLFTGDHQPTVAVFLDMLHRSLSARRAP